MACNKRLVVVGQVAIRKLVIGGIIELTQSHRIETQLNRNPLFGQRLPRAFKGFSQTFCVTKAHEQKSIQKQSIQCDLKAKRHFLNDRSSTMFHRQSIYVCFSVEKPDGLLVDFPALKDFSKLSASLKSMNKISRRKQSIQCDIKAKCHFLNDRSSIIVSQFMYAFLLRDPMAYSSIFA